MIRFNFFIVLLVLMQFIAGQGDPNETATTDTNVMGVLDMGKGHVMPQVAVDPTPPVQESDVPQEQVQLEAPEKALDGPQPPTTTEGQEVQQAPAMTEGQPFGNAEGQEQQQNPVMQPTREMLQQTNVPEQQVPVNAEGQGQQQQPIRRIRQPKRRQQQALVTAAGQAHDQGQEQQPRHAVELPNVEAEHFKDDSHVGSDFLNPDMQVNLHNTPRVIEAAKILDARVRCISNEMIKRVQNLPNDPCARLARLLMANKGVADYASVRSCYLRFPYLPKMRDATMETLRKSMAMYVFLDFSTNPPPESKQKPYDVLVRLSKVEARTKLTSDWQLQEETATRFVKLNDGHLGYTPQCYRMFTFRQPFFMSAMRIRNKRSMAIYAVDRNAPRQLLQWEGAEIISINGQKAIKEIARFSDKVYGHSKDKQTRRLRALSYKLFDSNTRGFKFVRGAFASRTIMPDEPYVDYELRQPGATKTVKVRVPWTVHYTGTQKFADAASYWKANCVPDPIVKQAGKKKVPPKKRTHGMPPDSVAASKFQSYVGGAITKIPGYDPLKPLVVGPGFGFFVMRDAQPLIGVLVISTFSTKRVKEWRAQMRAGFYLFQRYGITRLILDLSNNGGGSICLARTLSAYLDPQPGAPFPTERLPYYTDMRLNPFLLKLQRAAAARKDKKSPYRPTRFIDPHTLRPITSDDWLVGKKIRTSGQKTSVYSRFLMDPCYQMTNPFQGLTIRFQPKNMVVLTNGYCGSSCAILAAHLQEVTKVTSVVQMLRSFDNMEKVPPIYSFAGGQLQSYDDLRDFAINVGLESDPSFPPPFPTKADLTFTLRQIYSRTKGGLPLEYYRMPASTFIEQQPTNIMNPFVVWLETAAKKNWRPKPKELDCKIGKFANTAYCDKKASKDTKGKKDKSKESKAKKPKCYYNAQRQLICPPTTSTKKQTGGYSTGGYSTGGYSTGGYPQKAYQQHPYKQQKPKRKQHDN